MRSDAELVNATLADDHQAYAELVHRYERSAKAVAAGVLNGDIHAAEDAAQEAFVKAYRSLHRLWQPAAFGPWLLKIVRREALNMVRRDARHPQTRLTAELAAASCNGDLDENARRLLAAVLNLPAHERRAVMLRHFRSLTVKDVADATGRSVGTVSKQLSRAHARLRLQLKDLAP